MKGADLLGRAFLRWVVRLVMTRPAHDAAQAQLATRWALAVELGPHLRSPIHLEVLGVHPSDLRLQFGVAVRPRRGGPAPGGPIRRRGELQNPVERLDPEVVAVGVDVGDHRLRAVELGREESRCELNRSAQR